MTNEEPVAGLLQDLFLRFKWQIAIFLVGLTLVGVGYYISSTPSEPQIQILEDDGSLPTSSVTVEIAGSVKNPGVYKLDSGSRIEDLINMAQGFTDDSDREWVKKYLNRAAILSDGQKIYIPSVGEQSPPVSASNSMGDQSENSVIGSSDIGLTNINTATQNELEDLPGIGPVYAQKIIDNRPYSSIEDLKSRDIVKTKVYEEIKNMVTVY